MKYLAFNQRNILLDSFLKKDLWISKLELQPDKEKHITLLDKWKSQSHTHNYFNNYSSLHSVSINTQSLKIQWNQSLALPNLKTVSQYIPKKINHGVLQFPIIESKIPHYVVILNLVYKVVLLLPWRKN